MIMPLDGLSASGNGATETERCSTEHGVVAGGLAEASPEIGLMQTMKGTPTREAKANRPHSEPRVALMNRHDAPISGVMGQAYMVLAELVKPRPRGAPKGSIRARFARPLIHMNIAITTRIAPAPITSESLTASSASWCG